MPKNNAGLRRDTGNSKLEWWLDDCISLPGGYRIGLDGIVGLIPVIGDAIGGGLSLWIVVRALKAGAPKTTILRMFINIIIDTAVGAIPIVGDLFDFIWKANLKNGRLLAAYEKNNNSSNTSV